MYRLSKITPFIFILIFTISAYAEDNSNYFTIKDMRGVDVNIPKNLTRIATISDGFVESIMTHLGVIDKIVAIGSYSMKRRYKYQSYEYLEGKEKILEGKSTMLAINPELDNHICINSPQGNIISYEALAKSRPELVIMRVGDCTVRGSNKENLIKTIDIIENLGIALVVLYSPTYLTKDNLSSMRDEMQVLGDIFNQRAKALKLYEYLSSIEKMIKDRTRNIADDNKQKVLYIGLNSMAIKEGGSGFATGLGNPESYIIESVVNGRNIYRGIGSRVIMSAEQIYALDPDVILLPTLDGYHPVAELYKSQNYKRLSELRAIRDRRVFSMPFTPMNCSRRLEYPIDILVMAKAIYPEVFSDIKVHEFILKFYKDIYGVDDLEAKELRSNQLLDWTVSDDF